MLHLLPLSGVLWSRISQQVPLLGSSATGWTAATLTSCSRIQKSSSACVKWRCMDRAWISSEDIKTCNIRITNWNYIFIIWKKNKNPEFVVKWWIELSHAFCSIVHVCIMFANAAFFNTIIFRVQSLQKFPVKLTVWFTLQFKLYILISIDFRLFVSHHSHWLSGFQLLQLLGVMRSIIGGLCMPGKLEGSP